MSSLFGQTEPRQVHATARFFGPPDRAQEAAEAWAFELKYYFRRGVGEQPAVTYKDGIYTCVGLIQTTHPGDHDPVDFTAEKPWDLDFSTQPDRQERLRNLWPKCWPWFDGKEHDG